MGNIIPTQKDLDEAKAFNEWFDNLSEEEQKEYVDSIEADNYQEEIIQEP